MILYNLAFLIDRKLLFNLIFAITSILIDSLDRRAQREAKKSYCARIS